MFRSEMQAELLGLILLQPDRTWTLDVLAEQLSAPQSSVHRELSRLLDAGLVTRDSRQRPHRYQAATEEPAYGPLRELLEVTVGLPMRMSQALTVLPGVQAAAIHGSWAAGRVRPASDLDVVVITDGDRRETQRAVRRVGRAAGRDVDVSVLSPAEFVDLVQGRNPFVGKILHGPRIDLVGDLDALGEDA
jgi:predicted nucleotidyltransferase